MTATQSDYGSTARALALPVESSRSPSPTLLRPPWNPSRHSMSSVGTRPAYGARRRSSSVRDNMINQAEKMYRRMLSINKKLTPLQRVLVVAALIIMNVLFILFLVFNEKIFDWLEPYAEKWKETTGGWVILWILVFMTAFPPLIGFGALGTTAGFVYGVWEGWLIYASAFIAGSFCSFVVSRTILRKYVERLVANDKRFAALTLTLKHDGLKLLCMIRLCPLPYSLSNGAISTFPTVHPVMYALASAIVSPKLLVHVFIGSRLKAIAKSGEKMSSGTKAVNWISIIAGGLFGVFTGWYIYQRTMARARELEAEERSAVHQRNGVAPPEFQDDPDARVAASTIASRDNPASPSMASDTLDYFDDDDEVGLNGRGSDRRISSPSHGRYRDEFTDTEEEADDDIFGRGDGDEEETIGLHRSRVEVDKR